MTPRSKSKSHTLLRMELPHSCHRWRPILSKRLKNHRTRRKRTSLSLLRKRSWRTITSAAPQVGTRVALRSHKRRKWPKLRISWTWQWRKWWRTARWIHWWTRITKIKQVWTATRQPESSNHLATSRASCSHRSSIRRTTMCQKMQRYPWWTPAIITSLTTEIKYKGPNISWMDFQLLRRVVTRMSKCPLVQPRVELTSLGGLWRTQSQARQLPRKNNEIINKVGSIVLSLLQK